MASHTFAAETSVAEVMDALRVMVKSLQQSSREVQRATGISGAQFFVLQQLAAQSADSLNALAARTSTHQSSVSVVVSRLAARGLVAREPAADDARRTAIRITPAGEATLAGAPATLQERLVDALRALPAERIEQLSATLREVLTTAGLTPTEGFFFEDDA